ncbi:MAG: B12-binding domain-containing radical SAM protein [Spirochaetae bacterium HGW-Spirochaetae-1]|jgi:radical SAM superfamily enzyme YgiQ (UPF0313 family)|nr:MAG: B12-binding domain-containing radical SAM protein [Spirochaetae bacterium HGW-Spirochaetae-1]
MTKKFLLINPPYPLEESPSPPFGLMSLAAYLNKNNIDVIIEDFVVTPYTREYIENVIDHYKPDLIGATGVTMNIKKALAILEDCRDIAPKTPTVLGGPHATFDAQNILAENIFIDFIVRGEGEVTATELVKSLSRPSDLEKVAGISYRRGNEIVHNGEREFIQYLDSLPFPARHLCNLNKYKALGLPIGMMTSRGCPHRCIFCVGRRMVGGKVRYFSVERVVDELQMLAGMGFRQINIVDDLFTSHKKRCTEICNEIINRNIKVRWSAFARVDTIDRELLSSLHQAGCTVLCFGIESGNQEILDTVKKRTTLEMCRKAVAMCREAGILPLASYILGLPGETAETVTKTMEFAGGLGAQYGYHILSPFPGTEVRDKCAEYGIRIFHDDWDKYDANQAVCEPAGISGGEIDAIYKKFNNSLDAYIQCAISEYQKGTHLSDELDVVAEVTISRAVAWEIIKNNITGDPRYRNRDENALVDELVSRLAPLTSLSESTVKKEIRDFFKNKYLVYHEDTGLQWSSTI